MAFVGNLDLLLRVGSLHESHGKAGRKRKREKQPVPTMCSALSWALSPILSNFKSPARFLLLLQFCKIIIDQILSEEFYVC